MYSSHEHNLCALITLAAIYEWQDKYRLANTLYRQLLMIHEAPETIDQERALCAIRRLADMYCIDYQESESLAEHDRALSSSEELFGWGHDITQCCLGGLLDIYEKCS